MAEPFAVFSGVLRGQRRSLLVWGLALAVVATIYVSFYPAMGSGTDLAQMMDGLPDAYVQAFGLDDIASAAGYLGSTVYGLLGPALLLVFGIGTGARLVAGEEESGTLELELTHPVSRRRVVAERLLALVVDLVLLVLVVAAVTVVLVVTLDLEVAVADVVATATGLLLLALAFAVIALSAGAVTGRRGVAVGVAAALAVLAYMADAIAPLLDGGDWLQAISPFAWYLGNDPLTEGFDPVGFGLLALLGLVAAAVAVFAYDRRDLGV